MNCAFKRVLTGLLVLGAVSAAGTEASAVSARWAYEDAYDNVGSGAWYRDDNNETALLAWGESYVMMSLAAMYRTTGDPVYLERLAWHIDGVLATRDDARGVTDYRGVSGACWQNHSYQPANQPYCYVVHTGMLTWPMVEWVRLVQTDGLELEQAPDGESYGAKATRFLLAAEQSVAYHDDQWNAAGYYIFRSDATFLTYAGVDLPLNQSNALGRTLLALYEVTSTQAYLDKASALATRFRAQCTTAGDGALLWNYWGGAYSSPGEDISHAALNVSFAVLSQQAGVGFSAADLDALAATFVERVYVDDATFSDWVGGGSVNNPSYLPQVGRWLMLTPQRTTVYTAVRDLFERDYPASGVGSGSVMLGWALLAEHEPRHCVHTFYSVDWDDQGPHREATAYGANVLTAPPSLGEPCVIPLEVDVPRQTVAAQWDGNAYHRAAEWQPTSGFVLRRLGFEPRWPFEYGPSSVLFQFEDTFVAGDGIRVMDPTPGTPPIIVTAAPPSVELGTTLVYPASGTGDLPYWWSLPTYPVGARVDAATGALTWTPTTVGPADFALRLENDWGSTVQGFTVQVTQPGGPDAGVDAGFDATVDIDGAVDAALGQDASTGDDADPTSDPVNTGCGCRHTAPAAPAWLWILLVLGWVRRRMGSCRE